MHRLHQALILPTVAFAAFLSAPAFAQGTTAEEPQRERADCAENLAETSTKLSECNTNVKTCEKDRTRLDSTLNGWSHASRWLGQLARYQSGETDWLGPPRGGSNEIDRLVSRINGGGASLAHRRLLVEAMRIVAPDALTQLRGRGASALDAWFTGTEPLDKAIVTEAQRTQGNPSPAGPPLTAALRLVQAFQLVAACSDPAQPQRECTRARQLQQLLESSGSLVLRRRIQDVWATECANVSAETTSAWVEDFPGAHPAVEGTPGAKSAAAAIEDAFTAVAEAAHAKLFSCFIDDPTETRPYPSWLASKLPDARRLNSAKLHRVDRIKGQFAEGSAEDICARAVAAMQTVAVPTRCAVPSPGFRDALDAWTNASPAHVDGSSDTLRVCSQYARLLWEGKPASIAGAFAKPPSIDEMVVSDKDVAPTAMARLRAHCEERRGDIATFPDDVGTLARYARGFGEGTERPPFKVDAKTSLPLEKARYDAATQGTRAWLEQVVKRTTACSALGLTDERCRRCAEASPGALYDCALLEGVERNRTVRSRTLAAVLALGVLALLLIAWARRLYVAIRTFAPWVKDTTAYLEAIGLSATPDRLRYVFPSRFDALDVALPSEPAWERWGERATIVRAPPGPHLFERDVNHAAVVARRAGASVVLLEHDDQASPDLSAVRATLEWSAKGGSRAVQILPVSVSRAKWSKSAQDLLDLVEESSLRGNPFELRGRIATSSQFFNRERLVSGLLAAAQSGHWMVVTGLRRFGKSSLVLEVARRLPGPAAYVDLTGFDPEIVHGETPTAAVEAILRYVCLRLVESARARWPNAELPAPPSAETSLDVPTLTLWFRDLSRACSEASSGRAPPMLVIIDEIEQALTVTPERLPAALDVLAALVGRLKSAAGDGGLPDGSSPVGVFLASALHPLLWAPLRTLANQSIMGSFQRVCVPCLGDDAASTMMRSLGARQAIRFTDAALERIIQESHGVPLLLRRIGSSVLELYDAERARQGSLGAVEIGIEGATEAIEREEREGSPLRVWIETEICQPRSPAGAMLRRLALEESVDATELRDLATRMVEKDFARTGIDKTLASEEVARRAEEAGNVMLQLLAETGLLVPHGDLTAPEGYSLPDSAIRRVLRAQPSVSAFPSARLLP